MMSSLLSTTPNAMRAAIATRSAQLVPLKSLSMTPKIRPSIKDYIKRLNRLYNLFKAEIEKEEKKIQKHGINTDW